MDIFKRKIISKERPYYSCIINNWVLKVSYIDYRGRDGIDLLFYNSFEEADNVAIGDYYYD